MKGKEEKMKEFKAYFGDKCAAMDEVAEGGIELGFLMDGATEYPIRCLPGLLAHYKELLEICFD